MDPRLAAAALRQPDARSCGAAVLVMARTIADPAYADLLATGLHPLTGHSLPGTMRERFTAEVLAMHRQVTGPVDVRGAAQLPWPRRFGTPPRAVARQLSGTTAVRWHTRWVLPWARADALRAIKTAAATRPVPVYVGSRWLPRHVVLVLDADLRVYEPAGGRVVPMTADAFTGGSLQLAGWSRPWCAVLSA